MLLSSFDESLSEPQTDFVSQVADATGCTVAAWEQEAPASWRCVTVESPRLGDAADGALGELLETILAERGVRRRALRPGVDAIAVPSPTMQSSAPQVVVVESPASRAVDVQRIVELASLAAVRQAEEQALRDENLAFAQQVTDDFEELTFLREIAADLAITDSSLTLDDVVAKSISALRVMIGARALYHVVRHQTGELGVAQESLGDEEVSSGPGWNERVVVTVAHLSRRRAVSEPYISNDLAVEYSDAYDAGVRQLLVVPIGTAARKFGWLLALNRTSAGRAWPPSPLLKLGHDEFGTWEASLLNTAASLIASQANNLELLREQERLLTQTVRSLASALDAKDAYTRGHSERVGLFSRRIALAMGYTEAAAERLYLAGLLHDVGKIGVSDATLRKPDKLTPEEFAEITKHPDEGWAILHGLPQLQYVLPAVLHHHEQFDGRGYPDRLEGEEIPLDARIMSVADAFDAMTSDRAYRAGMPIDKAVDILHRGAGRHWDPRVVDVFETVLDDLLAIRRSYVPHDRTPREAPALMPHCRS